MSHLYSTNLLPLSCNDHFKHTLNYDGNKLQLHSNFIHKMCFFCFLVKKKKISNKTIFRPFCKRV